MIYTKKVLGSLLLALASLTQPAAQAETFPSHPIKWVVPYLPGTGPDLTARILAIKMSKILDETIIIENRGGVGGNIGAQLVARAPADGYTWIYSGSPIAANMRMYSRPGYDVMKDFDHVGGMTESDSVLVVKADSKIKNLDDLINRMRADPDGLTYASGGIGTPSHIGSELTLASSKTKALHIPYKGASESLNAVIGNQVDFAGILVSVAHPQIVSGKIRALAILSNQRNVTLPDVPTAKELGHPDVLYVSSGGISVPKGTPADITRTIEAALMKTLEDPAIVAQLQAIGSTIAAKNSQGYTQTLALEIENMGRIMQMLNLKPF